MPDSGAGLDAAGTRSVLHITTVPSSLMFLRGQLDYLKARGWTVHVLSAPGRALRTFGEQEGVLVHDAPFTRKYSLVRDLRALIRTARLIRRIKPDIVHAHTPKAALIGLLAAAIARRGVRIYQVRGLPLESARGAQRALLRLCERLTCSLADVVVCQSRSLQEVLLSQHLCKANKCITLCGGIGNGVDAEGRFNPARVSRTTALGLREQHGIPADALVVGYVGRLARAKGLSELEQAWRTVAAQHRAAHLLILGALDARSPAERGTLEKLRAQPTVHYAGRVDDPVPFYAAMDVLVLPSYREGMPNAALEAAAMRLPVLATRTTGCVDAVRDRVTGLLVEPYSAAALAGGLDTYLRDRTLREQHGAAGRVRMLAEFRQPPLWATYQKLYTNLLAARWSSVRSYTRTPVGKRCFDVAAAALLLLVSAPLMAVVALAIRTTMGAPILFRQIRAGAGGRPFTLHKFRTMREARAADGESLPPEQRLTRLGRWLRATSIDELPQLWDVLRGRMSLVGPRPLLPDYLPLYNAEQARRHQVRPGVTGWAQVNGRNGISWQEKLNLDVWYVDHVSPGLDLRVLLRTVPNVLKRVDVSPANRSIMERFRGN